MKAQITFIGKAESPTAEVELKSTNNGSFAGRAMIVAGDKIYFTLVILMPEKYGKAFETKKQES